MDGARLRKAQAKLLPRGWVDLVRQIVLVGLAYGLYSLVRGLVSGDATAAFQHARDLIALEQTLHVFVEPSVQAWASGSRVLMGFFSWLYVNAQTSITLAALVYLYVRQNRSFYFVRNMFAVALLIALVGYALFPTAPPRFLPEWGGPSHFFTDSVSDFTGVHVGHASATMNTLFNPYAAVPSMHVAFALMIGWPLASLSRSPVGKVLWRLYPLLIAFVIVATANHFVLDALLGALTAGASAVVARRLGQLRPAAWRFGPATAGAG
ncbi:MAG TPA: phosphatase PAP2 family protein [Solirubrobacteraceae bacterium]|nr:phosphatase PAP2 family protein [Solirubrobacteraceae bacterium]